MFNVDDSFQHGTCPICRKSLGDEGLEDHQPGSGGSNMSNVGPSLAAFFRYYKHEQ